MNSQSENELRRIERISALLRGACTVLLCLVGLIAAVAAVAVVAGRVSGIDIGGQTIAVAELTATGRILVAAVGLATAAVIVMALLHLRRLLDNYSRREVFTVGSATQLRRFGVSCILWAALKVVWAFLPLAVLAHAPRTVGVNLDALVIGAVIVVVSWFAKMAAALREENELTV